MNEEMIQEYMKCSEDIKYFINNHVKPIKEFNIDVTDDVEIIIGYLLYTTIFNYYKTIVIVSETNKEKINFYKRFLEIYNKLPDIFKIKILKTNNSITNFENGCKIYNHINSSYCLKGITMNILVLNKIKEEKSILSAALPTLYRDKNSKLIKINL